MRSDAEGATDSDPVIDVRDVTKRYALGSGVVTVLDSINLSVPRGTTLALRGVSGSGKSTLLHLMGAIDKPTSGIVRVDGQELGGLSRSAQADFRARSIGFVFQFFNLMPTLTVAENVMSGLEPLRWPRHTCEKAVSEALEGVRLLDQAGKYPAQLSGGQQQRVAIARALVKKPPVLLADEPTGALDEKTARIVLDCMAAMRAQVGCTVVLATHDPIVADFADCVYRVGGGLVERER